MENMREDPLEVLAEELTRRVAERISAQIEEASRQRELLTLEGAREHLGVSKTTLWNFRNRGMPEHVIGGKVYFFRSEIDGWVRGQ